MIRVLDSAGSTLVEWGRQQQQQHDDDVGDVFEWLFGEVLQDVRFNPAD